MKLITMNETKAWLLAAALFIVAVLLTGCAAIRAQQAEQARWQAMADQVTARYHVPSIYVRPVAGLNGQYRCRENAINLGTDATPFLLAHELGHYVLGPGCAETLADEMAANAFAIEAMQVWGTSRPDAVRTVVDALVGAQRRHVSLPAHDFCAEAADVLRRYPTYGVAVYGPCATAGR